MILRTQHSPGKLGATGRKMNRRSRNRLGINTAMFRYYYTNIIVPFKLNNWNTIKSQKEYKEYTDKNVYQTLQPPLSTIGMLRQNKGSINT